MYIVHTWNINGRNCVNLSPKSRTERGEEKRRGNSHPKTRARRWPWRQRRRRGRGGKAWSRKEEKTRVGEWKERMGDGSDKIAEIWSDEVIETDLKVNEERNQQDLETRPILEDHSKILAVYVHAKSWTYSHTCVHCVWLTSALQIGGTYRKQNKFTAFAVSCLSSKACIWDNNKVKTTEWC